ncbi:MAG: DUF1611 domain-containing protein [bacterium]|nr:DUF1611 domain-containing protein [bacterium]
MIINKPYLLFLGDAPDQLAAKTADGIAYWRRNDCLGQLRLKNCNADLGLPELNIAEAIKLGARTLIIGVANRGGCISDSWLPHLKEALNSGMDIASGLHKRLSDIEELASLAKSRGRSLFDVRHPTEDFPVGNGRRRAGKRLLTVGTDCSVGKMYAALAIEQEMKRRGLAADFRATGQTGILIAGSGVSIDAVVSDFISGAVEAISPNQAPNHWDIIEGQGSLYHPSYAGVSLGLLHGAQADALVMCHEPTRKHMRGVPEYPLPSIEECIAANETAAKLTNTAARCIGISINTFALQETEALKLLQETENRIGLPCVDAVRTGVTRIVDNLVS